MRSRLVSWVAWIAGALSTGILVAIALLAWRLSQGPVALGFLSPQIEAALSRPDGSLAVRVGQVSLVSLGRLELRAEDVRLVDAAGVTLVGTPDLRIGVSPEALLLGRIAPTRIELGGIRVRLIRLENGELRLGFGQPVEANAPEQADGFAEWVVTDLLGPPDERSPLGQLRRITVTDAQVTVRDVLLRRTWRVPQADFALFRDPGQIALTVGAALQDGSVRQRADLAARFDTETGRLAADLRFERIRPDLLVGIAPGLAPLAALQLPLSGSLGAQISRRGELLSGTLALHGGSGVIATGKAGADLPIRNVDLAAELIETDRLRISELVVATPDGALRATGEALRRADGYLITLAFGGLRPAILRPLAPGFFDETELRLDLGGDAALGLDTAGALEEARFSLAAGRSEVVHHALFPKGLAIASLAASGTVGPGLDRVTLGSIAVDFGGPTLRGSLVADRLSAGTAVQADLIARDVPTGELDRLWPRGAAAGARAWVTENLSDGRVEEARAKIALVAGDDPDRPPAMATLSGSLRFSGVTARYWAPLPPFSGVAGTASFTEKRFEAKLAGGAYRDVEARGGQLVFTGLDKGKGQEIGEIEVALAGPMPQILEVLDRPPLGYAKWLGVAPAAAKGSAAATIKVRLPLLNDVTFEQIDIAATGKVVGAELPKAAMGLPLSGADLGLHLDKEHMTLSGSGRLAGIPVRLDGMQRFDAKEPIRGRFEVDGVLDDEARAHFGIEAAPFLAGPVPTHLVYTEAAGGKSRLAADFDLKPAALAVPALAWRKPAGTPGSAAVVLQLAAGKPLLLEKLAVDAGSLHVAGAGGFDPATGEIRRLTLEQITLGPRNALRVDATQAGPNRFAVKVDGAGFDLRPLVDDWRRTEPDRPRRPDAVEIAADLDIARVWLDDQLAVDGVRGRLAFVGGDLRQGDLTGRIAGTTPVRFTATETGPTQTLALQGDDFGAALRVLGLADQVSGGRFELAAHRNTATAESPYVGGMSATDFRVTRAPLAARLFASASFTGLADLASADAGITFRELSAPFTLEGSRLRLEPGRAWGSAVGITFRGSLDFARDVIDVAGTLVPAYTVNRAIGAIPLLGPILTGEKGSGVFAATYRLSGSLDEPEISINPLAVLAPGFLRGLFGAVRSAGKGEWDPALDPAVEQRQQKAN